MKVWGGLVIVCMGLVANACSQSPPPMRVPVAEPDNRVSARCALDCADERGGISGYFVYEILTGPHQGEYGLRDYEDEWGKVGSCAGALLNPPVRAERFIAQLTPLGVRQPTWSSNSCDIFYDLPARPRWRISVIAREP